MSNSTPNAPPLAIVGASARAAAWSAYRAGLAPSSVDLFADADLRQIAACCACDDYPFGLARLLESRPAGPWMYTGALENYPQLVTNMAARRPLWGNSADVLRAVRDPVRLFGSLAGAGFRCPDWSLNRCDAPGDGSWLRKTLHSGGGDGVSRFITQAGSGDGSLAVAPNETANSKPSDDSQPAFYQRYIAGIPCAAVYVGVAGTATLLGVTRQLIGLGWAGATGFRYCGSLGPLELPPELRAEFERLGCFLTREFGLRGLFGVDAVIASNVDAAGGEAYGDDEHCTVPKAAHVWPIEVNPRYTASVEILERALGIHAVTKHAAAFQADRPPDCGPPQRQSSAGVCGKLIVYAPADSAPENFLFPAALTQRLLEQNAAALRGDSASEGWPLWADIPVPGSQIQRGWPILTVLAGSISAAETMAKLRCAAAEVLAELACTSHHRQAVNQR